MQNADELRYEPNDLVPSSIAEKVLSLRLVSESPHDFRPTFSDLSSLRGQQDLELRYEISPCDEALSVLRFTPNVTSLNLGSSEVTDAGMHFLRYVPALEFLDVTNTRVGDDGICCLLSHRKLNRVFAFHSRVTILGERMLRASIPGCRATIGRSAPRGFVQSFDGAMFVVAHWYDVSNHEYPRRLYYVAPEHCDATIVAGLVADPIGRLVVLHVGEAGEPDRIHKVFGRGDERIPRKTTA